jgi:hypothetical protein
VELACWFGALLAWLRDYVYCGCVLWGDLGKMKKTMMVMMKRGKSRGRANRIENSLSLSLSLSGLMIVLPF